MPIRKFNYTARRRIRRSDVTIEIRPSEQGCPDFHADINLRAYSLPPDARVFVEAYRQTTVMRFPWGAVSALTPPRDTRLTEFDPDARILFRVKVTDVSQRPGVLLAVADQVTSRQADEQPDRRIPLLTAEPDDIGDELWRIDFESEPALLINKFLPDWKAIVRSDYFRALVYPAALRMILTRILIREKYAEIDDLDDWRSRWLVFASSIPGAGAVPTTSDRYEDWIEDAVSAFARHFGMRDRFVTAMEHTL